MRADEEQQPGADDESPRRGFWSNVPKRSLSRIVLLLVLFAGILYLQRRTGAIAGCMSDAFRVPPPAAPPTVRLKMPARSELHHRDAGGTEPEE